MLHVRVHGPALAMETVAKRLAGVEGAAHITRADAGDGSGRALVTADLRPGAVDAVLERIDDLGVPATEVSLLRLEEIQHGPLRRETLVVLGRPARHCGRNARPVARYLVFMAVAGVIAAYGVIYENSILIVGAMAVSPDLLPITATCVAIAVRRPRLAGRALWTLAAGLGTAGLAAALLTALLDLLDLLPSVFLAGGQLLSGLTDGQRLDPDHRVRGRHRGHAGAGDPGELRGRGRHLRNHDPGVGLPRRGGRRRRDRSRRGVPCSCWA